MNKSMTVTASVQRDGRMVWAMSEIVTYQVSKECPGLKKNHRHSNIMHEFMRQAHLRLLDLCFSLTKYLNTEPVK